VTGEKDQLSEKDEKYFSIRVIGCQMNVYDGDKLRGELLARGWTETADEDGADFLIFLTCSVRDRAEQKALSELGKFKAKWEKSRRPNVALLGCMAARIGAIAARKFPWIRVAAGPAQIGLAPDAMDDVIENGSRHIFSDKHAAEPMPCLPKARNNQHKAYITVANGCDQFCTYCIVPYVRGRFASRAPGDILREAKSLVDGGAVEITLLGQNVDAYGKDFTGDLAGYSFASLLSEAASIDGLKRLRFTTSHPSDFTEDILETMIANPNICRWINLPVQAGSDKVLREMNRGYTTDEYISLVGRIRSAFPDIGLTSDLIVGFPGETEEEFEQSAALLEELRFDLVHTAAYSKREGTPASTRADQVSGEEKARRLVKINGIQTEISRQINSALMGKVFEVLLDERAPKGPELLQGRTASGKVVLVKAPPALTGTFQNARITGCGPWCLEGELL
jgi:tRNA-2-methylthio-N6-dimethylallyladenosine synthase